MSRLPRLASSPVPPMATEPRTLKRKAGAQDNPDLTDKPRKLHATASRRSNGILRPSRTATNQPQTSSSKSARLPAPLTKPFAPRLATTANKNAKALPRGTGANAPTPSTRPNVTTRASARASASKMNSNAKVGTSGNTESRLLSIETALAESKAQVEATMAVERAKVAELQASHLALSQQLVKGHTVPHGALNSDELEAERRRYRRELEELESELRKKERKEREVNEDLRVTKDDLQRERDVVSQLKSTLSQQSTAHLALRTQNEALQTQNLAAQSERDAIQAENARLRLELEQALQRIAELEAEAREAEMHRRKLHNAVQELKGNIRVFCRVRPVLQSEQEVGALDAGWAYPDKRDKREIVVSSLSESAMGQERKEVYTFKFDRVFAPHTTQEELFEEVSQLAQSCTDGYNVCIFAYGQTGSGKSFTMEGGTSDADSGMIPRAVDQVFKVTEDLKSKGWLYKIEGEFIEIYNETINDLLGKHEFDKKKHEIRHEKSLVTSAPVMRVTDINVVTLTSPSQVRSLLAIAQSRRSVASTLMNERSSRSHSVFTLRVSGTNSITGEKCEGSLNLVDLAGSERLKEVGHGLAGGNGTEADKDRLKETQNINRSLSALGDVIAALGESGRSGTANGEKQHVPYRNSKLTYLLQYSLSGNSKTLMILNLSPMATHLNESLTSLRFATKVNNTTVGIARKQTRAS